MNQDPIVQEVRQLRAQYAVSLGNDLRRIFEDLRSSERQRDAERANKTAIADSDADEGSGNRQS